MTMLEAAQKIPKGVNIVIFIWALIGLYFLLRNPKIRKDFYFWLFTAVIGFMVAWRIVIRILTSRYAAGLIVPFAVLAAVFLVNSAKRRHFIVRLGIYVLIAVTGFIVLKMNVDSTTRNSYSDMIAEVFEDPAVLRGRRPVDHRYLTSGQLLFAPCRQPRRPAKPASRMEACCSGGWPGCPSCSPLPGGWGLR